MKNAQYQKCSDYDEDCPGMENAVACWMYDIKTGYCPLLRKNRVHKERKEMEVVEA
jgi:hypothetical protein